MRSRAITVAAFVSLTCIRALAAQAPPDVVPIEFVRMLTMTPYIGGTPEIAVGRLPDRLASDLAPGPDMRIIGSLGSARFTASALVMPGRSAEVQERLVARLVEKGWKKPPPATAQPTGGFQTGPPRERGGPVTLCSADNHNVQLVVTSHRGDSVAVRLFLARGNFGVPCADPELASPRPAAESPLPALHAPAGTEYRGGGTSGGSRVDNAEGRLRTDMEPAALLEHYATQLSAAGWQPGARTASAEVAFQVFRKTDASRVNWQAMLHVIALPNRERELHLRVTRER